jgi:hypothetical protein
VICVMCLFEGAPVPGTLLLRVSLSTLVQAKIWYAIFHKIHGNETAIMHLCFQEVYRKIQAKWSEARSQEQNPRSWNP